MDSLPSSSMDDIGFMGPVLARAKKVLFPEDAASIVEEEDRNDSNNEKSFTGAEAVTMVRKKKKTGKSRARRAGRLETGSSLAVITSENNNGDCDGKENNRSLTDRRSLSSSYTSKNNKRGGALRKMDSLVVASNEVVETKVGKRRSDGSRSILELHDNNDSAGVESFESSEQQNYNARRPNVGRRSNSRSVLEFGQQPEENGANDNIHSNQQQRQQQIRRRGRTNHPVSSLVQSESITNNKTKSKRGSVSSGGIISRSSTGTSSLMALPSSQNQKKKKKKSTSSRAKKDTTLNISSLTNDVGRLSLDNDAPLSPTFRSPLTIRHRSTGRSSVSIASPESILRFSTMSDSNVFQQQVALEQCSPVPCLNPRKRQDKKKTPPKIIGLSSSQSPSEKCCTEPSKSATDEIGNDVDVDTISHELAIVTEAETYIGRRMARIFDNKVYHGTVTRFIKTHRLWKISYDDGDKEEMDFAELSYAMDLYDGKIKEPDVAESETTQNEKYKPGSAVIDIEQAISISKPTKVKRTYSKLPAKKIQVTNDTDELVLSKALDVKRERAAEPTRKSNRAAKLTDRLTVASWETKPKLCKKDCDTNMETVKKSLPVTDNDNIVELEPKQSQQQVCNAAPDYDGIWTTEEITVLRDAIKNMNPTSMTYWDDVSCVVGTKTSDCCRQKWFSLVATPRVKRAVSKKESKPQLDSNKCKKVNEIYEENEDDDLFDATPFRGEASHNPDDINFDESKFTFGLSPCVLHQRIEKSEKNEISNVKNRRKGYNKYIENLRKDLNNQKSQNIMAKKALPIEKKMKGTSDILESIRQNVENASYTDDEMDDIWDDV